MTTIEEVNKYGEELEYSMVLQTAPLAVKMLEKETDIPDEAFRPIDRGYHIAQCQAFALSRRNRETVAMLKEDNWCPSPVSAFGLVPGRKVAAGRTGNEPVSFEYGKYIGILTAPLRTATFIPDEVIIYCDTNQLRVMLLSLKIEERSLIRSNFFPASCSASVVPVILNGEYWISLPDPGEYVRALTAAGEMIFSIPWSKMAEFMKNLSQFNKNETGYEREQMMMKTDFPQPEIYKRVFEEWGMDHD